MAKLDLSIVANLVDNVSRNARKIKDSLRGISQEANKTGDESNAGMEKVGAGLLSANAKAIILRTTISTLATTAVAVAVTMSRQAANIEREFNKVARALDLPLDKTVKDFKEWKDTLLDLAKEMPEPFGVVRQTMEDVIRAGITSKKQVKELTQLFVAAKELGDKAPQRMAVMSSIFGKDPNMEEGRKWMEDMIDTIIFLDKKTRASAPNLMDFFIRSAPDMKRMGFGEKDILALGTLFESDIGKGAQQASRTLMTGLMRLRTNAFAPGKKPDAVAGLLGFKDAQEMHKGLMLSEGGLKSIVLLMRKLQEVGPERAEAFLRQGLGMESTRTLGAILNEDMLRKLEQYRDLTEDPARTGQTMKERQRELSEFFSQWDMMINKIQISLGRLTIAQWLNDILIKLMQWSGDFVEGFAGAIERATQKGIEYFNNFKAAIQSVMDKITALSDHFANKWADKNWWFSHPPNSGSNVKPQSFRGPVNGLLHPAVFRPGGGRSFGGGGGGSLASSFGGLAGGGGGFGGSRTGGATPPEMRQGKEATTFGGMLGRASFPGLGGGSRSLTPQDGVFNQTSAATSLGGALNNLQGSGGAGAAVDSAANLLGLHERTNRGTINQFLRKGGVNLDAARTAWCAAFVNSALNQVGLQGTGSQVATSFMNWGSKVKPSDVQKGDVLVQHRGRRPGQTGGHVGFATGNKRMGPSGLQLEMLSGNSSDKVTKRWHNASALAVRRTNQLQKTAQSISQTVQSTPTMGGDSSSFPDFRGKGGLASIRNNNPGAMWPGPTAKEFGMVGFQNLKDGQGNKIATFPSMVHGAAAQLGLLGSKGYMGKTIPEAIAKWSGGNNVSSYLKNLQKQGINTNQRITPELMQNPNMSIPLARAMAGHEAGKKSPMAAEHWNAAHQMFMKKRYPGMANRGFMNQARQQNTMTQGGSNLNAGNQNINTPVSVRMNVNRPANIDSISQNVGSQVSEKVKRALNNSMNDGVPGYTQR